MLENIFSYLHSQGLVYISCFALVTTTNTANWNAPPTRHSFTGHATKSNMLTNQIHQRICNAAIQMIHEYLFECFAIIFVT